MVGLTVVEEEVALVVPPPWGETTVPGPTVPVPDAAVPVAPLVVELPVCGADVVLDTPAPSSGIDTVGGDEPGGAPRAESDAAPPPQPARSNPATALLSIGTRRIPGAPITRFRAPAARTRCRSSVSVVLLKRCARTVPG